VTTKSELAAMQQTFMPRLRKRDPYTFNENLQSTHQPWERMKTMVPMMTMSLSATKLKILLKQESDKELHQQQLHRLLFLLVNLGLSI
jgi:hypothetical protein